MTFEKARPKIIQAIKDKIKTDKKADIQNISWKVIGFRKLNDAEMQTVIGELEEDGKYRSEKIGTETYISVDPDFKLTESVKSTNRFQKVALITTTILSATSLGIAYFDYKKEEIPRVYLLPQEQKTEVLNPDTQGQISPPKALLLMDSSKSDTSTLLPK